MIRLLARMPDPVNLAQLRVEADALDVNEVAGQVAGYWDDPPTQQEWDDLVAAHRPHVPLIDDALLTVTDIRDTTRLRSPR